MLENKMPYICNDVLTFSSKGHGPAPTLREGVGGGRSLLENDEDMYIVFLGSFLRYSD